MRASARLACALLALALPAGAQEPWTLERLLEGFARSGAARASFVERKTVRVLEQPLVSSGELRFVPPQRLEKRTLRPRRELLVLDGDALTLEGPERRLELDLRSHPGAAALVQAIRGTLAGDREALEALFRVELEGGERSWALVLEPRALAGAALVERVRISGRRADISVIEIRLANGDRTLMSVQRVRP